MDTPPMDLHEAADYLGWATKSGYNRLLSVRRRGLLKTFGPVPYLVTIKELNDFLDRYGRLQGLSERKRAIQLHQTPVHYLEMWFGPAFYMAKTASRHFRRLHQRKGVEVHEEIPTVAYDYELRQVWAELQQVIHHLCEKLSTLNDPGNPEWCRELGSKWSEHLKAKRVIPR